MALARSAVLLSLGAFALVLSACAKQSPSAASSMEPAPPSQGPAPQGQGLADPPKPALAQPEAPDQKATELDELHVTHQPAPKPTLAAKRSENSRVEANSTGAALSPEIIHRVVRQSYPQFHACYEAGLKQNPTLQGRMTVKLVISKDGATRSASVATTDLPDRTVATCVTKAFSSLSFPPPDHGELTVNYPVAFSPSGVASN